MIQEYRLYLRKLNKNPYIRVSRIRDEDYNFYRRMCNLSRLELDYYNAYRYDENAINSKADARKFSLAERKQLEQSYFTEQEVTWILRFKYNRYAFRLHKPHQTEKQIRGHQKSECLRVGLIYAINDDIRDNTLTKLSDEERAKFLELERQKRRAWFKYLVFMGKEDKNLRPMPGDDELMASVTEEVKAIKEKLKEERKERRKAEKQEEKDREKKLEQREKERAKLALQEKKKKQEALEKKKKAAEKMRMRKHRFDKKPASSSN